MKNHPPVLLLILDGFGYRENPDHNAIALAAKPNWDKLWRDYPHTVISTSGLDVGLPEGQMGNSEVGHLNIGAGRVVYQELTRIDLAIRDGSFYTNTTLQQAVQQAKQHDKALHVLGLLSPGGVHSHELHIQAMVELAVRAGLKKIYVHAFLDGRDTPPRSAEASLRAMQDKCAQLGAGRIASIMGRYYAMDRDNRWDRVQAAYDLLTQGQAEFSAPTAEAGLQMAYARGENDEFVKATVIGAPVAMQDGDVAVFMNFRADRARQITRALTEPKFDSFARGHFPKLATFVTLSSYGEDFHLPMAYGPSSIHNGFGEYVSNRGMKQLRIAETEKYAHVTYFFSGGREQVYPGEDRVLVPSPKVATYDLKPEMSAFEVTDKLEDAIRSRQYQAIICNYANGDMVGHSGNLAATIRACEVVDEQLKRIVASAELAGARLIVTADHGNCEMMIDPVTGGPHTAHTTNPVPLLLVEDGAPAGLRAGGALCDVGPTVLGMLGVPQPPEMTGKDLRILGD